MPSFLNLPPEIRNMIYSLLRVVTEPIDLALRLPYIDGLPKLNYGRNLWFAYVADVQPISGISVRFMEAVPGSLALGNYFGAPQHNAVGRTFRSSLWRQHSIKTLAMLEQYMADQGILAEKISSKYSIVSRRS